MSRWRRKRSTEPEAPDIEPEFSDVRIVKPDESSDIAAELSAAFSDEEPDESDADDETAPTARTTISIGSDDELPDAPYLDQALGVDDDSGTVFIDDDGTGDAIAAKDATARGIEPRIRQRRIGVRRAEGRRRLRIAAIAAAAFVAVVAVLAVLGSSLFSVTDIDITGQQYADADRVDDVISDLLERPVLLVDTDEAERRFEQIAFVADARVRTSFPRSVTIELREREPVATVQGVDGRYRILDVDGRVLDVIDGQPIAFVLISGTSPLDLAEGQFAAPGYASAASIVTKLTPAVRSRLISMSVTPDGSDLRFILSNEPGENIEVRLGMAITDDDQIQRLVRLERLLDDAIGSDTTTIDVSTAETTER